MLLDAVHIQLNKVSGRESRGLAIRYTTYSVRPNHRINGHIFLDQIGVYGLLEAKPPPLQTLLDLGLERSTYVRVGTQVS